jgi:uncharacterized protein (TIGR02452 family)
MNVDVYRNNNAIFKAGGYTSDAGKVVLMPKDDPMLEGTKVYCEEFKVDDKPVVTEKTKTGVVNMDSMQCAKLLIDKGLNPAVLNLASAYHACGGYHTGSRAQEEGICRESTLSRSLYQYYGETESKAVNVPFKYEAYPLDLCFGGIYSPGVTVFRDPTECYRLLEEPYKVGVITVAALNFRPNRDLQFHDPDTDGFTEEGDAIMRHKIRTIYRLGLSNGHDSLVLGAFGCGAFRLRPTLVANLFKEVLQEPEFHNKYKEICFAILEKGTGPKEGKGKFAPFYQLFG